MNYIKGKLKKIIYHNNDSGYVVALFRIKETNDKVMMDKVNKSITVRGIFTDVNIDISMTLYGYYTNNDKFGMQYAVESYEIDIPTTKDGIIEFLASSFIEGCGERTAKKIVDYLKTLKANFKEFWVELGLQTANKKIADSLNIGYDFNDFENAVKLLSEAKIPVVVHIINGLPHESKISMISTIKKINKKTILGIKFHALNILKGTKLAEKYQNKPFKLLTLEEYIDIVIEQLQYLKGNIVVHRISGDSLAELLIAPLWVYKKLSLSNLIDQKMNELDVYQGEKFI